MNKSFFCQCGNEIEIEVPHFYKGDIRLWCAECKNEWIENPYEHYCDSLNDSDREAV